MTMLISAIAAMAGEMKTITLNFSKQQFSFVNNSVGAMEIAMSDGFVGYGSDTSLPGLPLAAVNVRIPNGTSFGSMTESTQDELLFNNVVIAPNPTVYPGNYTGTIAKPQMPQYSAANYPDKNVQYVTTSTADGYTVLRFLVCPFKYDAQNKKLFLTKRMSFNINLNDTPATLVETNNNYGNNLAEIIKSQVVNADEFEESDVATYGFDLQPGTIKPFLFQPEGYIIVTSEELAPYFQQLALWKKTKGLNAKIVTMKEIKSLYPEKTEQLALKMYLEDQYDNNKLRYVLFGGDDSVVPVQYCYYSGVNKFSTEIPTDLFYACFNKTFNWDKNGDKHYGTVADDIDLTPSIFVTRVPVRTVADAGAFVNRILGYEQNPTKNGWSNNILMAGDSTNSFRPSPQHSDVEYIGNKLYQENIAPYWDGTRVRFYDTKTDFNGDANYDLTLSNFQEQLSNGYTFIDMMTHGSPTAWKLEKGMFYNAKDAEELKNKNYSIITTKACLTNAFDEMKDWDGNISDPCLSEAFMRNSNSGVVAYWGPSREGWSYASENLGPTLQYEAQFYRTLFSQTPINKNFGAIIAAAKSAMISYCNFDGSYRWLQFGMNPIGDPEMPIYTTTPKRFSNIHTTYSKDGKNVTIDTGVDSCKICIMSKDDYGESFYYVTQNAKSITSTTDKIYSVCITKQNYIPRIINILPTLPSTNSITNCSVHNDGNAVTIATQLSEGTKDARIVVASTSGLYPKEYKVSSESPTITIDISNNAKGVQTVTLFVEGISVDSNSFIKK